MRIALTHPSCWPYVRRGTERNMDDLARWLVGRGHEVVTVSTRPPGAADENGGAGRRVLHRPIDGPLLAAFRVGPRHTFLWSAAHTLRTLGADVVHSFYASDALAAAWTRRRSRHRTVLQMNGVAVPGVSCYRWLPPEGLMFREAIRRADVRVACSDYVRRLVLEHYGMDARVVPPLLGLDRIPLGPGPGDGPPTFLSVADFTVRTKGVRVLVKAFAVVKERVRDAVLRLSGRFSAELERELLGGLPDSLRSAIQVLGLGRPEDLPRTYGTASVMVLPSMGEPSANSVLESLAAGTPVVITDHGGAPEYLGEGVGITFDPATRGPETLNVEGLAEAMRAGLEIAARPGIRARCRAHAERYFPGAIGPRYESLYAG